MVVFFNHMQRHKTRDATNSDFYGNPANIKAGYLVIL